jgi:hypothetical protein
MAALPRHIRNLRMLRERTFNNVIGILGGAATAIEPPIDHRGRAGEDERVAQEVGAKKTKCRREEGGGRTRTDAAIAARGPLPAATPNNEATNEPWHGRTRSRGVATSGGADMGLRSRVHLQLRVMRIVFKTSSPAPPPFRSIKN